MLENYQKLKTIFDSGLKENEPLARYTTFKIGGPADLFFAAKTVEELEKVIVAARKLDIPIWIFGGGSNVLVADKGVRGLVIKNATHKIILRGAKGNLSRGKREGLVYLEVDTGVVFNQLVRLTIAEGLSGLEMHLGLPGTVGGAIYMNSKWTKPVAYVGDAVYQATLIKRQGEIRTIPAAYFHFGYDRSIIQQTGDIVTKVIFALHPADKTKLWEVANKSIAYRRQTQPQGVLSPGCTFRNLTKATAVTLSTPGLTTSAGFLLDHAGLKGLTVGGAQISPVHANFIINKGKATASDVLKLIEIAKETVRQKYGVELQEEIVKVGEFENG